MDLESLLGAWDGETVIVHHDQPTGAWILIALHSTRLGPAGGGTRMKSYPNLGAALQDACRLSAGMTYKLAVPGGARTSCQGDEAGCLLLDSRVGWGLSTPTQWLATRRRTRCSLPHWRPGRRRSSPR